MGFSPAMNLNPKLLERIQKHKEQNAKPIPKEKINRILQKVSKEQIPWEGLNLEKNPELWQSYVRNIPLLFTPSFRKNFHKVFTFKGHLKIEVYGGKTIYAFPQTMDFIGPIRRIHFEGWHEEHLFLLYEQEDGNVIFLLYNGDLYKGTNDTSSTRL